MNRIVLYFKMPPERDRWLKGDRIVRSMVRRVLRGKPWPSGVEKVFINLCLGLEKLGYAYEVNMPFEELLEDDYVGALGLGPACITGYDRPNRILAGVALVAHPSELPPLCDDYPIVKYLQPSEWTINMAKPYFGEKCAVWPVGIDTETWKPRSNDLRTRDFLVYDKIMWDYERNCADLKNLVLRELDRRSLTFEVIRYGSYKPYEFQQALHRCRAMIFLCQHESQGIAYQECLSSGVPIFAWDQGWWLDPNRFGWGQPKIPATSVPYFDERCGMKFRDAAEFTQGLEMFVAKLKANAFRPRDYVVENLTLEKCAEKFMRLAESCRT